MTVNPSHGPQAAQLVQQPMSWQQSASAGPHSMTVNPSHGPQAAQLVQQPMSWQQSVSAGPHSMTVNPSYGPQAAQLVQQPMSWQQSVSAGPHSMIVNPSHFYGNRPELEHQARIETERRRKQEAEQAAKRSDGEQPEVERRRAVDTENAGVGSEAEIQAMFQKMRQFNIKNPAILAKLREDQRRQHAASESLAATEPLASSTTATKTSSAQDVPRGTGVCRTTEDHSVPPKSQKVTRTPKPSAVSVERENAYSESPIANVGARSPQSPDKAALLYQDEKAALSELAAKWLSALPANSGKPVSQRTVLNTLNSNPSYPGFCQALEDMGLEFERSALACELSKTFPKGQRQATKPFPPVLSPAPGKGNFTRREVSPTQSPAGLLLGRSVGLPKPPADKEESARKRTFDDLVDLTADESDDGQPPSKIRRPSGGTNGVHAPQQSSSSYSNMTAPSLGASALVPAPSYRPREHVPVPELMLMQATKADFNRDTQQTQPFPQPAKPSGPLPEWLQRARLEGKMLVEPIKRDRVARKSRYDSTTIARDVLLATGRHPDMGPLNNHLIPMSKLLTSHGADADASGSSKCDLATIKWDVIDPEPSVKSVSVRSEAATENGHLRANRIHHSVFDRRNSSGQTTQNMNRKPNPPLAESAGLGVSGLPTSRLPSRHQRTAVGTNTSNITGIDPNANMSFSSTGYAAFKNQLGPDGQAKKERPFGSRKNVHSREAPGLAPATKPGPSHQMQSSLPAPEPQLKSPQWQGPKFACKWEKCKSELMNLQTLENHIDKAHGISIDGNIYECRWGQCQLANKGTRKAFLDGETWMEHVNREHLRAVAWANGDGPMGGE